MTPSFCFCNPSVKLDPDKTLKLGRLIAFGKFHKMCKFKNHVRRNDVIMMSLPKTMKKCVKSEKQVKLYIIRKVLTRGIQKCTFYQI